MSKLRNRLERLEAVHNPPDSDAEREMLIRAICWLAADLVDRPPLSDQPPRVQELVAQYITQYPVLAHEPL